MTGGFSRRAFFAASFAGATSGAPRARPLNDPNGMLESPGGCLPFVSVLDFGATGADDGDASIAVRQAYNSLAATGGVLFFPRGRYRVELELTRRNIHLVGEGPGATILTPARPDGVILRAVNRQGSWQSVTIKDLSLRGNDQTHRGIGVFFGGDDYQPQDEYTGRIYFSRVEFEYLRTCISRPYGSIGVWVDACRFGAADYHFWCRGNDNLQGDPMHAGCLFVHRSRMEYFSRAMLFLDSSTDSGQVIFENNIFEAGDGFVAYVRTFNNSGGMPGVSFRNNWNEKTATGRNLEIEGHRHDRARFLFAKNSSSAIRFEDTPIGDVELIASSVETHNCNLQNLSEAILDDRSTLRHHNARSFSGTPPGQILSIASPPSTAGLRTPWFRFARPMTSTQAFAPAVRLRIPPGLSLEVGGPERVVAAGAAGRETDLMHRDGSGNVLLARHASLGGPCWIVSAYIYRVATGDDAFLSVNGTSGLSGEGHLSSRTWEMLVNVSENASNEPQRVTFYHRAPKATTIQVGGAVILSFVTLQDAMAFVDQQSFPA